MVHFHDDLTDEELEEQEKKIQQAIKDLKGLERNRESITGEELSKALSKIEKSFTNLPENVEKTFDHEIREIVTRIEKLK